MSTWKIVQNSDPGAGNVYGGDDMDNLFKTLNGVNLGKLLLITTPFKYDTYVDWKAQATAPANQTDLTQSRMYSRTIDSNNNGIFVKVKENNTVVEVRLA
jgi:hypothetical protein